jgi:hypothetical protein
MLKTQRQTPNEYLTRADLPITEAFDLVIPRKPIAEPGSQPYFNTAKARTTDTSRERR